MSVFGVDLGTNTGVVAVTRNGGVDIIINEVSKRETAAFVSLSDGERDIGERGLDRVVRNTNNTVSCIKRFIGMRADDPRLALEKRFMFANTGSDSQGRLTFELTHHDESVSLYPEQILAMYLGQLQTYVNREATIDPAKPAEVRDCVISVPVWYTVEQRRLLIQACEIANLNCMSLINETTAAALDYGIFRGTTLPEKESEANTVAIVDIGYSDTTVTIGQFWKGNMKVLTHAYDVDLGTRDIDYALAQHFAVEIKNKYKVDVSENKRSRVRLLQACEKVKTMLSANKFAPLNIENLQDVDVSFQNFPREQMEEIIAPLLQRFVDLCRRAVASAGIDIATFTSIEMIGGGCRIPIFKAKCEEAFGRPPSFTLNTSESIARGCAITAAVFSPKFQVREYVVNERCMYPIMLGYHSDKATAVSQISFLPQINKAISILREGDAFPKVLELTFERSDSFTLYAFYDENNAEMKARTGDRMVVGEWVIGGHGGRTTGETKVRFRFHPSGLVSIDGASTQELYEVEETEEKKNEDGTTEKVAVKKEKQRKVELTVQPKVDVIGLPAEIVVAARKTEQRMREQDLAIIRAKEGKNALESLILDNRTRISDGGLTAEFVTKEDQAKFLELANQYEEWLYDEGASTTFEEYEKRLALVRPIAEGALRRQRLSEDIPFFLKQFNEKVRAVRETAIAKIGKAAHISDEELNGAAAKCDDAQKWGEEQYAAYLAAPKFVEPTFLPASMDAKLKEIETAVRIVVNKPVPPPPKKEEKPKEASPAPPAGEAKPAEPAPEAAPQAAAGQPEVAADLD